jgi:hypothetical protein
MALETEAAAEAGFGFGLNEQHAAERSLPAQRAPPRAFPVAEMQQAYKCRTIQAF